MKYIFIFFFFIFSLSLINAGTYEDCSKYGICKAITATSTASVNNNTLNVNNSEFWQGYTPQSYNLSFIDYLSNWIKGFNYNYNTSSDRVPYIGADRNVDITGYNLSTNAILAGTPTNGKLLMGGIGGTNNENLLIDFETATNNYVLMSYPSGAVGTRHTGNWIVNGYLGATSSVSTQVQFQESNNIRSLIDYRWALQQGAWGLGDSNTGSQLIFTTADISHDFDHPPQSTATIYIQSATDPNTNNQEWGSLYHTGTGGGNGSFVIESGTNSITLKNDTIISQNLYFGDDKNASISYNDSLIVNGNMTLFGNLNVINNITSAYANFGSGSVELGIGGNQEIYVRNKAGSITHSGSVFSFNGVLGSVSIGASQPNQYIQLYTPTITMIDSLTDNTIAKFTNHNLTILNNIYAGGNITGNRLGAGTTNPSFPLHIVGTSYLNGQLTATGAIYLGTPAVVIDTFQTTGNFISLSNSGPSGIGTSLTNPWIARVHIDGNWFANSKSGDTAYRNTNGSLLFGTSTGSSELKISNKSVEVNGSSLLEGNLNVTGNATYNSYYGEMKNWSINGYSATPSAGNVYNNFTNLYDGLSNGFKIINDDNAHGGTKLQAQVAGVYDVYGKVTWAIQTGGTYGFGVVNNSRNPESTGDCYSQSDAFATGGKLSMSVGCYYRLNAGDNLTIVYDNQGASVKTLTIYKIELKVNRVGN